MIVNKQLNKVFQPKTGKVLVTASNRLSVRVPSKMLEDVQQALQRNGRNLKERSDWICDAICKLNNEEDFWLYVQEEWIDRGTNINIQIVLDSETSKTLVSMIENVKTKDTGLDGDIKSAIVRTSIIQKLIKEKQ